MQSLVKRHTKILLLLGAIFFCVYSSLSFTTPNLFNSPDETLHYTFTKHFIETGELSISQKENYGEQKDFVFPRSTYAANGEIIPVGFWGVHLVYGIPGKIIGPSAVPYFTPLLVMITGLFFYFLIKRIFNEHIGFYSAILFYLQPVLWYYTARSMFPNVVFLCFLIMGITVLTLRPYESWKKKDIDTASVKRYLDDILGSTLLLTAILIRPSEIWWILIGAAIVWWYKRHYIERYQYAMWGTIAIAFLALYLSVNKALFGGGISSYTASESAALTSWYHLFFPFGFHPFQTMQLGYHYFVNMFWWLTIPAGFGVVLHAIKVKTQKKSAAWLYLVIFLAASTFLFIFYGSFLDARFTWTTIGIAYTRYWLPIFVFSLPFIVITMEWVVTLLTNRPIKRFFYLGIVAAILLMNGQLVYEGNDGLKAVKKNILHGMDVRREVAKTVPYNAIIATDTEDKFFWPEFQVIKNTKNPVIGEAMAGLLDSGYAVYYFGPKQTEEQKIAQNEHFSQFGLELVDIKVFSPHELRIVQKKPSA